MAERVRNFGQTHSMELIFFPLIILILVGLIANTFQSSAIQTVPVLPTPFCTGNIEPGECYPTNLNGCDSSVTNCNFTTKTQFSFFNANSPFTLLLQGNILGFFSTAFNQGENNNIIKSGYTICIPTNSTGNYVNQTGINIHNFECLGISAQSGNASIPEQFPKMGIPMNATSNGGNNSQWNAVGCSLVKANYPCQFTNSRLSNPGSSFQSWFGNTTIGASTTNFNSQMGFYGIYVKNGTTLVGNAGCTIYFSVSACHTLMPWLFYQFPTFTCPSTASVYNINILKTTYYCLLPTINQNTSTTSLPNSFSALSFLFGVLLFFAGFGLSLTSAVIGFNIDTQGTKLAQVFGIGILVWSFIFGEFGGWLNSLPFNLGDIGFVSFTIMFFMGLYWRLFTLD